MGLRREKITPSYEPIIVRLDSDPEGIQRESNFGVDYQYTLNNNAGIMWVPKAARDAIVFSGARRGDDIEIVKTRRGGYVVTRISDAVEPPNQPRPSLVAKPAAASLPAAAACVDEPQADGVSKVAIRAFEISARVIKQAEDHCKSIGLPVEAKFEDVRALAISFMIERSRQQQGGR